MNTYRICKWMIVPACTLAFACGPAEEPAIEPPKVCTTDDRVWRSGEVTPERYAEFQASRCSEIESNLVIRGNDEDFEPDYFARLQKIHGYLTIVPSTSRITNFSMLRNLEEVGVTLDVIGPMAGEGHVLSLSGMTSLLRIGDDLVVRENANLQSLGLTALEEVGRIIIDTNPDLYALGLPRLKKAGSVNIWRNTLLSRDDIDHLVEGLEVEGTINICGNLEDDPC